MSRIIRSKIDDHVEFSPTEAEAICADIRLCEQDAKLSSLILDISSQMDHEKKNFLPNSYPIKLIEFWFDIFFFPYPCIIKEQYFSLR